MGGIGGRERISGREKSKCTDLERVCFLCFRKDLRPVPRLARYKNRTPGEILISDKQ